MELFVFGEHNPKMPVSFATISCKSAHSVTNVEIPAEVEQLYMVKVCISSVVFSYLLLFFKYVSKHSKLLLLIYSYLILKQLPYITEII